MRESARVIALICIVLITSGLAGAAPVFEHVVIVVEENRSDTEVWGSSNYPYFNQLADNATAVPAAKLTNYVGITHPSQPNYLALFAGQTFGIADDDVHPASTFSAATNLGAKLIAGGRSFAGYSEDLPAPGSQDATSGAYARKHNPWANWQDPDIAAENRIPDSSNLPFEGYWPATDFSALPTVSIVVPNLINDGHDTFDQTADNWLNTNIRPYAEWAATHNSLLIITWDEDEGSGNVAAIVAGAAINPGSDSGLTSHYGLLRTIEEMYGLTHDTPETQNAQTISSIFIPEPSAALMLIVPATLVMRRRRMN